MSCSLPNDWAVASEVVPSSAGETADLLASVTLEPAAVASSTVDMLERLLLVWAEHMAGAHVG
jgi:hypothetical protein